MRLSEHIPKHHGAQGVRTYRTLFPRPTDDGGRYMDGFTTMQLNRTGLNWASYDAHTLEQAYADGWFAFHRADLGLDDCPYTNEFQTEWERGWYEASIAPLEERQRRIDICNREGES